MGPYEPPLLGLGSSQSPKAYEFRGALGPRATSHEFREQPPMSLGHFRARARVRSVPRKIMYFGAPAGQAQISLIFN